MSIAASVRKKTGEKCVESGVYRFDGYLDGTTLPAPRQEEQEIPLSEREVFPPIRSSQKSCWWRLVRDA